MKLSEQQVQFINNNLPDTSYQCQSSIVESKDPSVMSVIFWNPLSNAEISLECPYHVGEKLTNTGIWAHMRMKKPPRKLYHLGNNVLLVSSLYSCTVCGNSIENSSHVAHDAPILSQLPKNHSAPFYLFKKCGLTRLAYEFIINASLSGTSFHEISTSFKRSHGFHIAIHGKGDDEVFKMKHQSPSNRLCEDVFLHDFDQRLSFYEADMKKIQPKEISIDHTFNTR